MSGYIEKPLHNPINGSAEVVPMRLDLDARKVGWVYDEESGVVYPGAVFNAANFPRARP